MFNLSKRILRPLLFGLSIASAVPAFADIAITDVMGRSVKLAQPATRAVVGFYPDEFSAIAGPDGWDRVVGFAKRQWSVNRAMIWDRYRKAIPRLEQIEDVGLWEDQSFNAEKVLALRPDIVIVPSWAYKANLAKMEPLEAAGIPVITVDYNAQELASHVASTLAIGLAMGKEARARELADLYTNRLQDIQERAKRAKRNPSIYVEIGYSPETFGNTYSKSMWGQMVESIGANNIANGAILPGWGPIAPEKVLAAKPDFILITGSSWINQKSSVRLGYAATEEDARASLRPFLNRPGWDGLPAVQNRKVFTVEHTLSRSLMDWASLQFIAKQLYPDEFADVDPIQSLREFHEKYLPVRFEGVWMLNLDK